MYRFYSCLVLCLFYNQISTQFPLSVTDRLNLFANKFLTALNDEAGDSINVIVSPYTVWTLLSLISEGASGTTLNEINTVLNLPKDKSLFRSDINNFTHNVMKPGKGVDILVTNAVFTTNEQKLNQTFQKVARTFYSTDIEPTDFNDISGAVKSINSYVSKSTKGRIEDFIRADDVKNAAIFMTSVLYFKGQWKTVFNESLTHPENFYDDSLNNKIGQVQMMYIVDEFPFTRLDYIQSYGIELPYGDGNKTSMIIILPYKGNTLSNVLETMSRLPFRNVIESLRESELNYAGENVEVYLPKFKINSELNLNIVLDKMGIREVFNANTAELLGIFPHYLHVSRVLQRAEIEVNEEGTVASAAAGASLTAKITQPIFKANKPFSYYIVDKPTQSILFAGKITNPNTLI